ncbi:MAG: hypothetical protein EAZ95_12200 [Bacteroidetes bacterium]|nr:MAG: hypothetical protein EAZ95_12200 [Bacteroidota bacterium]
MVFYQFNPIYFSLMKKQVKTIKGFQAKQTAQANVLDTNKKATIVGGTDDSVERLFGDSVERLFGESVER